MADLWKDDVCRKFCAIFSSFGGYASNSSDFSQMTSDTQIVPEKVKSLATTMSGNSMIATTWVFQW